MVLPKTKASGILLALVLAFAAFVWISTGIERLAHGAVGEGLVGLGLSPFPLWMIYSRYQNARSDAELDKWLMRSKAQLAEGKQLYFRGQKISIDSELVRYHGVLSMLLVSFRFSSRWLMVSNPYHKTVRNKYSIFTAMFGWWGFPFGLIWTPTVLASNANGSRIKMSELIAPKEKATLGQQVMQNVADVFVPR